jgi:hypothetical protein
MEGIHHWWKTPCIDNLWGAFYISPTPIDLSYVVGAVSRYMQEPHELHWKASKHILRYVQGTTGYGIHYVAGFALDLMGFIDFDWDGDSTDHKSTSGYVLSLGFGPICWSRKK